MVSQALKHIARDYSPAGQRERSATFPYIVSTVEAILPPSSSTHPHKILLPGAALGALAHEISSLGPHIHVTTNEFSPAMNLAYRYLSSPSITATAIHPYIETWSHARSRQQILRAVSVHPPTTPSSCPPPLLMEGDFTSVFHHSQGDYAMVVTLFFIDTAQNLLAYLETIYHLLEPGGTWLNVGPLLYGSAPWVQLTKEEVVRVAEEVGFVFDGEVGEMEDVGYDFGVGGLYRHAYNVVHWKARKPEGEKGKAKGKGWW
jgi:carnosine N-methyltransferase